VPDTSGVFCPNSCDYCGGKYQKSMDPSSFCSGDKPAVWEATVADLSPFLVPDCQDAGTNLPRYCCTPTFTPVCP
jgi:hypothetical protein